MACADGEMVSGGVNADLLPTWLRVVGHGSVICDEGTSLCAGSSLHWTLYCMKSAHDASSCDHDAS